MRFTADFTSVLRTCNCHAAPPMKYLIYFLNLVTHTQVPFIKSRRSYIPACTNDPSTSSICIIIHFILSVVYICWCLAEIWSLRTRRGWPHMAVPALSRGSLEPGQMSTTQRPVSMRWPTLVKFKTNDVFRLSFNPINVINSKIIIQSSYLGGATHQDGRHLESCLQNYCLEPAFLSDRGVWNKFTTTVSIGKVMRQRVEE